ncbi:hypothetical protein MRX96_042709 [Rhipicephalus microplus]
MSSIKCNGPFFHSFPRVQFSFTTAGFAVLAAGRHFYQADDEGVCWEEKGVCVRRLQSGSGHRAHLRLTMAVRLAASFSFPRETLLWVGERPGNPDRSVSIFCRSCSAYENTH